MRTGRKPYTLAQRIEIFWRSVDKSPTHGGCWLWTRSQTPHMRWPDTPRSQFVSRIAYELTHGTVPADKVVLHTCSNRMCVNPAHLILGTRSDVQTIRFQNGTMTCGEDHPSHKLSKAQVEAIRAKHASGIRQADLAREYDVHYSQISLIVNGKRRRAG